MAEIGLLKKNNLDDFETFISHISDWLTYAKFWRKNSLPITQKLVSIIVIAGLLALVFLFALSELIAIKDSKDFDDFIKRFDPFLFHLYGLDRWIIYLVRSEGFENVFASIKRCNRLCLIIFDNEKDCHKYHVKTMELKATLIKFTYIWIAICIWGTFQWTLNPLLYDIFNNYYREREVNATLSRHLPYEGFYPWNVNSSFAYWITLMFQSISALVSGVQIAIYDILNVIIMMIVWMYIQQLNEALMEKNITIKNYNSSGKCVSKNMTVGQLKLHISLHQEILDLVQGFKMITSYQMFILCFNSTVALCMTSLEASSIKIDSSIECIMHLTSMAEYWLGITGSLYGYCYLADNIKELGLESAIAFYSCRWEQSMMELNLSNNSDNNNDDNNDDKKKYVEISQIITFSVMRAQKPIILTGGLFYILSLETFKALTGFSLSNALVLRQLAE